METICSAVCLSRCQSFLSKLAQEKISTRNLASLGARKEPNSFRELAQRRIAAGPVMSSQGLARAAIDVASICVLRRFDLDETSRAAIVPALGLGSCGLERPQERR